MKTLLFVILLITVFTVFFRTTSRAAYETAPFTVQEKDGDYEVRDYPQLTVATTFQKSDADGAFMRLFRYIQGANAGSQKIQMTTPVFMDSQKEGTGMSFVLPQSVAAKAPAATANEVKVTKRPAAKYAVFRYAGRRSEKNEKASLEQLREWMKSKGLKETGTPTFAYFDPPWTIGPFRRNEVMLQVAR